MRKLIGLIKQKNYENIDYNEYKLMVPDIIMGYLFGFILTLAVIQIFFEYIYVSLIAGVVAGFIAIKPYKKFLISKRKKKLVLQFKDFLESLSASYSSGKNTSDAFIDTYNDMYLMHGENSYITKEINKINIGLKNNINIEALVSDFGVRSGIDDIACFAQIFEIGNRRGSNLKDVISNAREVIADKLDIEMEIKATIAEKKSELYIMTIMPFIIIIALKSMGDTTFSTEKPINMLIRIIALITIGVAFMIGKKITNIKA